MGNRYSTYRQSGAPETTTLNVQESTPLLDPDNSSTATNEPQPSVQPSVQSSVQSSAPTTKRLPQRKPTYTHPFIDMINRNCSEAEMVNTLQVFCGRIEVGTDQYGRPIYESVDQIEFTAPVLQVFSYCANNGKKTVVKWLVDNFVPLQVSYDNNYCFFECLRWKHYDIADMIVQHESFNPTTEALENLLSRNKYADFRKCMVSPYLRGDMQTYRFTFQHYIDNNQYTNVNNLFQMIKRKLCEPDLQITDQIYPNPRLVQQSQVVQEPQNVEAIEAIEAIEAVEAVETVEKVVVEPIEENMQIVEQTVHISTNEAMTEDCLQAGISNLEEFDNICVELESPTVDTQCSPLDTLENNSSFGLELCNRDKGMRVGEMERAALQTLEKTDLEAWVAAEKSKRAPWKSSSLEKLKEQALEEKPSNICTASESTPTNSDNDSIKYLIDEQDKKTSQVDQMDTPTSLGAPESSD